MHFRGPLQLKQFAAYAPFAPNAKKREASLAEDRQHSHQHDVFHNRAYANIGAHAKHKRQEVVATIDGKVVSWQNDWTGQTPASPRMVTTTIDGQIVSLVNDWTGETATVSATSSTSSTSSTQWVTATIDGKVVSWINDWFGDAPTPARSSGTAPVTSSIPMVTATIDGQVVSWINNWFGGASTATPASNDALAPTPTSQSDLAPIGGASANVENAGMLLNSQTIRQSLLTSSLVVRPEPTATSEALVASPSLTASVTDKSTTYEKIGYYDSASQTLDNLVFLGNYGGQGSGVFDE